jgi:endonuclease/exonuclease/phosphatase family metal-dependent hydrolase
VTFNIRYNNPNDGENAWPYRKDMVADMVRFFAADILGVQEALKDQIDDIDRLLPELSWIGVGRDDGLEKGEYSAIFYRTDRFELLNQKTFWLSETPDIKGSKGWDADCVRIVTWGKFRDKHTTKTLYLFNTHFDHRGKLAREKSAGLLLSKAHEIAGTDPVIITGDFNLTESSPVYDILTSPDPAQINQKLVLKDARYLSIQKPFGPDNTFNGFGTSKETKRIDFIFVNDHIKVITHGILTQNWGGRYPSDHMPVISQVCIK